MIPDRASLESEALEMARQLEKKHRENVLASVCYCGLCRSIRALDAFLAPKKAERLTPEARWSRYYSTWFAAGYDERCTAFLREIREAEEAAFREARACVPTNWCDELLTGTGANAKANDCHEVERILRGVQDRIDALIVSRMETQT